ncbi:MAG: DJ-1/PfpI family protein [Pseudomonadota bacterium]
MTNPRRRFLKGAAQFSAIAPFLTVGALAQRAAAAEGQASRFGDTAEEAGQIAYDAHEDLMKYPGLRMHGAEQVAMVVYPQMTMLDLVGPQFFFAMMMGATVHLVSKDPELTPIMGDTGFAIVPTISMADCPKDLDILFVGGGTTGTVNFVNDEESIAFMADRGSRAKNITSVCTGSMILGKAGLLEGKKATSHWAVRHLLSEFGAKPTNARVVTDGNVTTGAGVSAGLDFALALLGKLRGEPYARSIQLAAEYAPDPIYDGGTLETTDPKMATAMHEMYATAIFAMKEAAKG